LTVCRKHIRTEFIGTWVTPEELAQIDRAAGKLSRAGFLRGAVLRVVKQELGQLERQQRRQRSLKRLRRIGESLEVVGA
jgi:hypothetical protein